MQLVPPVSLPVLQLARGGERADIGGGSKGFAMKQAEMLARFTGIEHVVADELRFKRKLWIGEDAYASFRVGKSLQQIWDVGGIAATGGALAASAPVAGAFFGGGWLAAIGIGTASTPIGWVIAAAVASGGAYYGGMRLLRGYAGSKVETIPKFLNTKTDLLGAVLFDLMAGLAVHLARADGDLNADERAEMMRYFVEDWGFDAAYVARALDVLLEDAGPLETRAPIFAAFARANPDCNFSAMRAEYEAFLHGLAQVDGEVCPQEKLCLAHITAGLAARRVQSGKPFRLKNLWRKKR